MAYGEPGVPSPWENVAAVRVNAHASRAPRRPALVYVSIGLDEGTRFAPGGCAHAGLV